MQINKSFVEFGITMNSKYPMIAALAAVMLVGVAATAALATEDAFADKKKKGGYEKSQAVSQVNDCGNGELPLNVWCQNTASQIQGDENEVALASEQGTRGKEGGGCPTC
jgi:hypothetical protein